MTAQVYPIQQALVRATPRVDGMKWLQLDAPQDSAEILCINGKWGLF